jgi:hypothetical protein
MSEEIPKEQKELKEPKETKEPKKRGRKKLCEIDSIQKLRPNKNPNGTIVIESKKIDKLKSENIEQKQISFGKFNIIVQQPPTMSSEEIRSYFDKKFKIDDNDKSAKMISQDTKVNTIPEPITEDYSIKKVSNFVKVEEKQNIKKQEQKTNQIYKINRILANFVNNVEQEWPKQTDVSCWWCCHKFNTIPLPCPVKYDNIKDRFYVNGIFCSWGCVAAYSVEKYTSLSLVYLLRNKLQPNDYDSEIQISPSRYCLKEFGGYMDIDCFRNNSEAKYDIMISSETMEYVNQEIVEIKRSIN